MLIDLEVINIRIAICDDELLDRNLVKDSILLWAKQKNTLVDTVLFDNGDEMLDYCRDNPVDILLLDIVMPLLSGMEAAAELRKTNDAVKIIFLTSNAEYAVESYDVDASGYLLKPLNTEKLFKILDKYLDTVNDKLEKVTFQTSEGYRSIALNTIESVEASCGGVIITLKDGEYIHSPTKISDVEQFLTIDKGFYKCHRSYIASFLFVDAFNQNEIKTVSGLRIPIARGVGKKFKKEFFLWVLNRKGI